MKSVPLFNFYVVTLFVCLFTTNVSSLRCYKCESNVHHDKSCTKLEPHQVVTCSPDEVVCRTLKAGGNAEIGYNLIQRTCGTLMQENVVEFVDISKSQRTFNPGVAVSSTICNTDLCNAAPAILKTSPIFCLFITVILFLKYFY